jgi:hypothetical protein
LMRLRPLPCLTTARSSTSSSAVLPSTVKMAFRPPLVFPVSVSRLGSHHHRRIGHRRELAPVCAILRRGCAGVRLNPLASAEVVLNKTEREMGVCVCDIGGGTSDLALYSMAMSGTPTSPQWVAITLRRISPSVCVSPPTGRADQEAIRLCD